MEHLVFSRKFPRRTVLIGAIAALLVMTLGALMMLRAERGPVVHAVPFSDLLRHLDRGAVSEVVVNGDALEFKLTSGESFRTVAPANYVTANAAFVPDLAKRNVRIDVRTRARADRLQLRRARARPRVRRPARRSRCIASRRAAFRRSRARRAQPTPRRRR